MTGKTEIVLSVESLDVPLKKSGSKEDLAKKICILYRAMLSLRSFPGGSSGTEPTCKGRRHKRCEFDPWVGKIPWRRLWQPTPVFLPGESHGQRSLAGYSSWGHKDLDRPEATARTQLLTRELIRDLRGFCPLAFFTICLFIYM